MRHSLLHREVVPLACMASMMGYAAVTCVLALIRYYGAVTAEVVKSMRKVLQVGTQMLGILHHECCSHLESAA